MKEYAAIVAIILLSLITLICVVEAIGWKQSISIKIQSCQKYLGYIILISKY